MPVSPEQQKAASRLAQQVHRAEQPQHARREYYKACRDIYDALLKPRDSDWKSDLHPPFAQQFIETVVAAIIDEPSEPKVEPINAGANPGQAMEMAEKIGSLLQKQQDADRFAVKWPNWCRGGLIDGIAVNKNPWEQRYRTIKERVFTPVPGSPIPMEGDAKTTTKLVFDQPSFVRVDPMDFWWNEDATDPEEWETVYFRTWQTVANLKALAGSDGIYKDVDQLQAGSGEIDTDADDTRMGGPRKRAGSVELIEVWTGNRLRVLADRKVIIRDEDNPFGHGMIPFVAARPLPRPGKVLGWSMCELIGELQIARWDVMNHASDNTTVLANAVLRVRDSIPDIDEQTDRFPGQVLKMQNPLQDAVWDQPPVSLVQPLMEADNQYAGLMSSISGAVDYLSGADSSQIDQTTATGISIIQSTAQKRLQMIKQEYANALNEIGQQQIELNDKLMTVPEILQSLGPEGFESATVYPHEVCGFKCRYKVSDVNESLNQQQKRSEAILKLQTLAGVAALVNPADGAVNLVRAIEDFSEAFGDDRDAYLSAPPPPMPSLPGMPGSGPGAPLMAVQPGQPTPPPGAGVSAAPPMGAPPYVDNAPSQGAA